MMKKTLFVRKRHTVLLIRICSAVLALYMLYLGIGTLLNIGNLMISFQDGSYSAAHRWSHYSVELLCGAFTLLGAFIFGTVVKTGMPFSERLSKLTAVTGITVILAEFIPSMLDTIAWTSYYMMPHTVLLKAVERLSEMTLVGVLLLMLALVMRYGAMLQQESDETL